MHRLVCHAICLFTPPTFARYSFWVWGVVDDESGDDEKDELTSGWGGESKQDGEADEMTERQKSCGIKVVITLVHRNNELSEIYRDYFVINSTVHSHCTSQKIDLHISSVQKSIGQKSIQYIGSVLWNEIPQLLKNPMSKYTFKRKLKAHLLNEQAIFWILCTLNIMYHVVLLIFLDIVLYTHLSFCTLHLQLHVFCLFLFFFVVRLYEL